jgi:hypothetical protein
VELDVVEIVGLPRGLDDKMVNKDIAWQRGGAATRCWGPGVNCAWQGGADAHDAVGRPMAYVMLEVSRQ